MAEQRVLYVVDSAWERERGFPARTSPKMRGVRGVVLALGAGVRGFDAVHDTDFDAFAVVGVPNFWPSRGATGGPRYPGGIHSVIECAITTAAYDYRRTVVLGQMPTGPDTIVQDLTQDVSDGKLVVAGSAAAYTSLIRQILMNGAGAEAMNG